MYIYIFFFFVLLRYWRGGWQDLSESGGGPCSSRARLCPPGARLSGPESGNIISSTRHGTLYRCLSYDWDKNVVLEVVSVCVQCLSVIESAICALIATSTSGWRVSKDSLLYGTLNVQFRGETSDHDVSSGVKRSLNPHIPCHSRGMYISQGPGSRAT